MAGTPTTTDSSKPLLWPVFALSCGLLGFEISLLRILLYASWHHFAFLVISVALLGFGASGTVLCFLRRMLARHGERAFFYLAIATAVSLPVCAGIAQHVPVEARFVPALLARQASHWMLYWLLLMIPFLLGATALGLAVVLAGPRLPAVYASNLAGSALGALLAPAIMCAVDPEWLPAVMGGVVWTSVAGSLRHRARALAAIGAILGGGAWLLLDPPAIRIDPYKYLAQVRRLVDDGAARRVALARGPRGTVEVFTGSVFHDLAFLTGGESPPPLLAITVDGHASGSMLQVEDAAEAQVVDRLLMAYPYAFAPARPRVLLLGETGGVNVWLAARHGASAITVVQPNRELVTLLERTLRDYGGHVFGRPGVSIERTTPRHFVTHSRAAYDLIQLSAMESWAVETGGIGGLNQDHLMTVEGLAACLRRLSPDGILAMGRGIQLPPRDELKVFDTVVLASRRIGIEKLSEHVVVVRDFLGACTLVKRSPWRSDEVDALRREITRRELTPVYFPGVRSGELNRPDALPGPTPETGDWLHVGVTRLLSGDRDAFVEEWAFDIRAPGDDRPFFGNFTKLRTIGALREAFGDLWLTRTELSLVFVLAALGGIAVIGVSLTVIPLLGIGSIRHSRRLGVTAVYFTAIGLAYLMLEITFLSRLTHLIGDPVLAGSATIAGFLLFSGIGSFAAPKVSARRIPLFMILLVAMALAEAWIIDWLIEVAGALPTGLRYAVAGAIIAPLGFMMGFPMPSALRQLGSTRPELIPWAWGVNGFASVLAPPLATAIGMTAGFRVAGAAALILYLVAASLFHRFHGPRAESGATGMR
jgi:spermidine synthase